MRIQTKKKGFIAILSLLIITTVSMIMALGLLKEGMDNASLSISSIYYANAKLNATVCLEDSLLRIKQENQFNRSLHYNIAAGHSCSSSIQWFPPQQTAPGRQESLATLTVSGTSETFTRTFDYGLKVKRVDITHTDGTLTYMNNLDIISITERTSG